MNDHKPGNGPDKQITALQKEVEKTKKKAKGAQGHLKHQEEVKKKEKRKRDAYLNNNGGSLKDFYIMNAYELNYPHTLVAIAFLLNLFLYLPAVVYDFITSDRIRYVLAYGHIDKMVGRFINLKDDIVVLITGYILVVFLYLLIMPLPSLLLALKYKRMYARLPFKVEGLIKLVRISDKEGKKVHACTLKIIWKSSNLQSHFTNNDINRQAQVFQKKSIQLIIHRANHYLARKCRTPDMFNEVKWRMEEKKIDKKINTQKNETLYNKHDRYLYLYHRYLADMDQYGKSDINSRIIEDYKESLRLVEAEDERVARAIEEVKNLPREFIAKGYGNHHLAGKLLQLFFYRLSPLLENNNHINKISIDIDDTKRSSIR